MVDNNLTPAEVLRRAADHMQKVGMTKHTFFDLPLTYPDDFDHAKVPCCARGAIQVVLGSVSGGPATTASWTARSAARDIADAAVACLAKHVPPASPHREPVALFNDHPDTTQEMMVALMRKAADECTCGQPNPDAPTSRDAGAGGK